LGEQEKVSVFFRETLGKKGTNKDFQSKGFNDDMFVKKKALEGKSQEGALRKKIGGGGKGGGGRRKKSRQFLKKMKYGRQ